MFDLNTMPNKDGRGLKRKPHEINPAEDPDYAFVRDNKKSREEDEKTIKDARSKVASKAYNVINRNFTLELEAKETEVEKIDSMLLQVQKSLHLVRYAAVANLYSGPNITGPPGQEAAIHSATRALLQGKRPRMSSRSETLSRAAAASENASSLSTTKLATSLSTDQSVKMEWESVIPSYVSPKSHEIKFEPRGMQYKSKRRIIVGNVSRWIECDQREDLSTHKWMLYVRGCKDEPDISDVVSKVRFLIHQSYHPNNLIEVHRPPYHLTRRGWGEFPARIQIHFKNPQDKPIDVVHNLKLDKTYTGLQTLGAETVVDVWLHQKLQIVEQNSSKTISVDENSSKPSVIEPPVKNTESKIKTEIKFEAPQNVERAKENIVDSDVQTTFIRCKDKEGGSFFLPVTVLPKNCQKRVDWNRSGVSPLKAQRQPPDLVRLPNDLSSVATFQSPRKQLTIHENGCNHQSPENPNSSLLRTSSLPAGTSLLRSKVFSTTPPQTPTSLSRPGTPCSSGHSTPVKMSRPELTAISWKSILTGKSDLTMEQFEKKICRIDSNFLHKKLEYIFLLRRKLLSVDKSDFQDDESFLMKIFRYFPLVSYLSQDSSLFKVLLPYTARTETEYQSWSITKQKATEWMRAKTLQRILSILKGPQKTTKELVILFRQFGFSYLPAKDADSSSTTDSTADFSHLSTYTRFSIASQSSELHSDKKLKVKLDTSETELIDVEMSDVSADEIRPKTVEKESTGSVGRLILSDDNLDAQAFVEHCVGQLGIRTEIEEVYPGVFYPLAQKLLLVACKSFCEEIIRQSHAQSYQESAGKDLGHVGLNHVVAAIVSNKRLKSFLTNQGLADPDSQEDSK